MSLPRQQYHRQQQYSLGVLSCSYGYEDDYMNENNRPRHAMDIVYLDDSKTPTVPPHMRNLPIINNNANYSTSGSSSNNRNNEDQSDGSTSKNNSNINNNTTEYNSNNNNNNNTASEEADAAAGNIPTTPRIVLERVTSLSRRLSSTSLLALGGITGGAKSGGETPPTSIMRNKHKHNINNNNNINNIGLSSASSTPF